MFNWCYLDKYALILLVVLIVIFFIQKHNQKNTLKDKVMKKRLIEIVKYLPQDKKQWQYGDNSLNHIRPKIDGLSKYYIENYCKEDFEKLIKKLNVEEENFKLIYGKGTAGKNKDKYKNYKENKINELYKRMGNSFLVEMKSYARDEEKKLKMLEHSEIMIEGKSKVVITKQNINKIKQGFNNEVQHMKNKEVK